MERAEVIPENDVPFGWGNSSHWELHNHANLPACPHGDPRNGSLWTEHGASISGGGDTEASLEIIALTSHPAGGKFLAVGALHETAARHLSGGVDGPDFRGCCYLIGNWGWGCERRWRWHDSLGRCACGKRLRCC